MPKFRTRPVEIEAWQYVGRGRMNLRGVCLCQRSYRAHLHTMHNDQIVELEVGDWIVPEPVPDRFYPIKPVVFAQKYEPVEEPDAKVP